MVRIRPARQASHPVYAADVPECARDVDRNFRATEPAANVGVILLVSGKSMMMSNWFSAFQIVQSVFSYYTILVSFLD